MPSCKKLGDAFEAGKKKKMTIAEKGNVKSASLPSINAEDSTYERAGGESTNDESVAKNGAKNDLAERSGATGATGGATAWEIPSGKAKKKQQKSKQRRNTQTITMDGAQVDSSQLYQAVCSYNPILFSHSGRSTEELSLVEGDVVKPLTNVDATGYLYAQVCGNKGLVPAAYLIPLNKAATAYDQVAAAVEQSNNNNNNNKIEGVAPGNNDGAHQNERINGRNNERNTTTTTTKTTHSDVVATLPIIDGKHKHEGCSKHEVPSAGQPHSPSKVFVQRVLSDFSILLGWVMPPMDEFGFSNGVQVKGYRIFVNDVLVEVVPSALQTKILVEAASFPKRPYKNFGEDYICFKVVATSVGGVDSPPSTCLLEVGLGAVKSETGSDVTTGSDVKACGGEGGGAVPTLTPGEQPLTESETTASEIETENPASFNRPVWKGFMPFRKKASRLVDRGRQNLAL